MKTSIKTYWVIGMLFVSILITWIVVNTLTTKKLNLEHQTEIEAKNAKFTEMLNSRDQFKSRVEKDSTTLANKKAEAKKLIEERSVFLDTTTLDQFDFGGIYWSWNNDPKTIKEGLNYIIGQKNQTAAYRSDIWNILYRTFGGDPSIMTDCLLELFKSFPNLFKKLYDSNKGIIKALKIKEQLPDQGEGILPYLGKTRYAYQDAFQQYYLYHTTKATNVYKGEGWDKFKAYCDKNYPNAFDDGLSYAYDHWRTVHYNLNAEQKAILLYILTDYNKIGKKDVKIEVEKPNKKFSISDLFK